MRDGGNRVRDGGNRVRDGSNRVRDGQRDKLEFVIFPSHRFGRDSIYPIM